MGDVYGTMEKHGDEKKYYIYKSLCKNTGKSFKNYEKNSFMKWIIKKKIIT